MLDCDIQLLVVYHTFLTYVKNFPSHSFSTGHQWLGFGVFNALRLIGVAIHQFVNGPLAPSQIALAKQKQK